MPIFSSDLETTLRRSLALARERRHEYATLEHLLLALTDDIDASAALIACGCNVPSLQSTVRTYLDSELENLVDEKVEEPKASNAFQRVVQRAAFQVQSAGNDEVTGVNVLAAIFAERDTHATFFLQEQNVTRYDVVNYISQGAIKFDRKLARVKYRIDEAAKSAPQFVRKKGRLSYVERSSVGSLKERKLAVAERLNQLRSICTARSNEQPQLNSLTNRYAEALGRLRVNNGSYNLFLIGLEIESLVRLKNQSITDRDRNIPLDADQLFAVHSLMTAHAGLIVLFPDINNITTEFDRYKELSTGVAQATVGILDTALFNLAEADGIFDDDTHITLTEVAQLDNAQEEGPNETKGTVATKHSWLRGSLAAIASFVLEHSDTAKSKFIEEETKYAVKNQEYLYTSVISFLVSTKPVLITLAESMQTAFGWLQNLFEYIEL